MSVFEPHTEGDSQRQDCEAHRIRQTGHHSRSRASNHYRVRGACARRPADMTLWVPALDRHQHLFGRAPDLAAGDRGFSVGRRTKEAAYARGVRRVVLPRPGRKTPARRAHERQRWFRRGQRWRVRYEGRISVLKRRHGLRRCRYRGADGMSRWVGLGVIANNLVSTATVLRMRTAAV